MAKEVHELQQHLKKFESSLALTSETVPPKAPPQGQPGAAASASEVEVIEDAGSAVPKESKSARRTKKRKNAKKEAEAEAEDQPEGAPTEVPAKETAPQESKGKEAPAAAQPNQISSSDVPSQVCLICGQH